jgi:hypothetical protein
MTTRIWSCWFQGENDPNIPHVNKVCLNTWKLLNPQSEVIVLDESSLDNYIPEFKKIVSRSSLPRTSAAKSDLLRLLLLQQYGGIWVDASLLPMASTNLFLPYIMNEQQFFAYRFKPRISPYDLSGDRECVSWFLAVGKPNHSIVNQWLERFLQFFMNADPYPFFAIHQALANLYDENLPIRDAIEKMRQISEHIPHSLTDNKIKKVLSQDEYNRISNRNHQAFTDNNQRIRYCYSFMYKRPRHVDTLADIACSWHKDLVQGRQISGSSLKCTGLFPIKQMTSPVVGCHQPSLMATMRDGICFFENRNPNLHVLPSQE